MSRTETSCQGEQISEVSFQPSSIGKETIGVHDTSFQSIMECGLDIRKNLDVNVVLSGGTVSQEIDKCVTMKLIALAPSVMKIKVVITVHENISDFSDGHSYGSLRKTATAADSVSQPLAQKLKPRRVRSQQQQQCSVVAHKLMGGCTDCKVVRHPLHRSRSRRCADRHAKCAVKQPPPYTTTSNNVHNHANNARKSWSSEVPIILPGWEHHTAGSRSIPTVHP